jgi:hypothetical protein
MARALLARLRLAPRAPTGADPRRRRNDVTNERTHDTEMEPSGPHGTGDSEQGADHSNEPGDRPVTEVDPSTGRPAGESEPSDWTGVGTDDAGSTTGTNLPPS